MGTDHAVTQLYTLLNRFGSYPEGVVPMRMHVEGTAFFPGGSGLWGTEPNQAFPPMPIGGVMVVGHNFDCETGFAYALAHPGENLSGPTWRILRAVLNQAGIPLDQCFFTNAYVGLKAGSEPTGLFPGAKDPDFVHRCQHFLLEQLHLQQPRLLLTLGKEVPAVFAPLTPELDSKWSGVHSLRELDQRQAALVYPVQFPGVLHPTAVLALTHPANRAPNVRYRTYKGREGDAAEQALLADAVERGGFLPHEHS